jgi:isoleucyl-tRNA synthetase
VEIGRALRSKIGIKVRYPLNSATLVCDKKTENLIKNLLDLLNEEINVKNISFEKDTSKFMIKTLKPNQSSIGKRLKEKAKIVFSKIESMDKDKLYKDIMKNNKIEIKIDSEKIVLTKEDFEIVEKEKEHIARAEIQGIILLLDTTLNPDLESEGFAREIVRRIQSMRKELDLDVEDKIVTEIKVDIQKKVFLLKWQDYIKGETRSSKITFKDKPSGELVKKWDIDEIQVEIGISK